MDSKGKPVPHTQVMGQQAAQGMAQAPSNMQSSIPVYHQMHLEQNFVPPPGSYADKPTPR